MATIITNYTTYDLEYYSADLSTLPSLSAQEEASLFWRLAKQGRLKEFDRRTRVKEP